MKPPKKPLSDDPEAIRSRQRRKENAEEIREKHKRWSKDRLKDPEALERRRASNRKAAKLRRQRIDGYLAEAKSLPCMDCQGVFHKACMDFDHVRGVKSFNLAHCSRQKYRTYEEILEEIAKCDIVCANCHRLRSWKRMQNVSKIED